MKDDNYDNYALNNERQLYKVLLASQNMKVSFFLNADDNVFNPGKNGPLGAPM
jgi:hypothetical protein